MSEPDKAWGRDKGRSVGPSNKPTAMPIIPIHVVTTSSGGGFETFGWDSLVAIGTLGLAIATLVLALKTRALAKSGQVTADAAQLTAAAAQQELELLRDQTDAAKRQSEAAEAALNASVLPVLLDIPQHTMFQLPTEITARLPYRQLGGPVPTEVDLSVISATDSDDFPSLVVPVRNVGAGVALGIDAAVYMEADEGVVVYGEAPSAIAVGGHDHVWFGGPEERLGERAPVVVDQDALRRVLRSGQDLVVEIAYSDVSGRQEAAASLHLTRSGRTDRAYRVTRVEPRHERRFTAD
jgi:hypothetical protein